MPCSWVDGRIVGVGRWGRDREGEHMQNLFLFLVGALITCGNGPDREGQDLAGFLEVESGPRQLSAGEA